MYSGSSSRLGSLVMPLRLSVETWYWSMTHSRARAVAEAVFVGFGRDAGEGQEVVVDECGLVFAEAHLLDAAVELGLGFDALQRIFGLLLVVDVEFGQLLARGGEGAEVGGVRDAGEFALEVGGVALAILGMMQHGIDVMEDVPLGDGRVG